MPTNIDGTHKMITSSGNRDFSIKQDGKAKDDNISKASSSSRPRLGLKDPRIVRVSPSFGGKDRHSKVYTMKGLRDRRVRLSVPTAIQLYALQDRLALNQPSKVVDWLLNAAKHEIDELPPLQALPGSSGQDHQRRIVSHEQDVPQSSLTPIEDASIMNLRDYVACSSLPSTSGPRISNNVVGENQMPKLTFWNTDAVLRAKCKEVAGETILEKNNWIKRNEQDKQEGIGGLSPQVLSHVSLQRANQSSLAGFLNNVVPYNSYHQCEPSNLSLFPSGSHVYSSQTEEPYNFNAVSLPSSLSLPPQLLVHPSRTTPLFFPPYVSPPLVSDPRQADHFQMLSSSNQNSLSPNSLTPSLFSIAQPRRPFQLNMNSMIVRPQNDTGSRSGADNSVPLSTLSASFFQNDPKSTHG